MLTSVKLNFSSRYPILATGSELRSSFAVLTGETAYVSEVFDDLKDPKTFEDFKKAVGRARKKLGGGFGAIACDLHPEYISAKYAKDVFENARSRGNDVRIFEIQHHHAHIAAGMAEHGLKRKVIGVAFDGTGYGPDGNVWGGEFLVAGYHGFERAAHIEYVPMPGGDKAVLEPARMAFSYLYNTYKNRIGGLKAGVLKRLGKDKRSLLREMIDKGINSPLTSSAGRLFDAVSSLVGIKDAISYEGEAAIELENIAAADCDGVYEFDITRDRSGMVIGFSPMIRSIVSDLRRGMEPGIISRKFHNTLAGVIKEVCSRLRRKTGLKDIVLSGGVFQNRVLSRKTREKLQKANFSVYTHSKTSCADSSLSLGQAVIAASKT